jgi:autotransporter translocation and assembly factor TamB
MELTGYMDIVSGKYGSWGQDFEIQTGSINFTDPNKINPDINIMAEKRSRDYVFELSINGNLEKQVIDLQVRDEDNNYLNYSDSDKLTLLTLGAMTSQLQASDLARAGGDVLTTSVETAFGRGAESITGLDKVELNLQETVVDLESMKLNNGLTDASISFGKYLTSNLYLEYRSKLGEGTIPVPKLTWAPGNQIFLEYRINKYWSLDSFYQQTQRGNNMIKLSLAWKTTF